MEVTTDNILLIGSVLLFIAVLAGNTSHRFGVPTLLFFLAIGMVAGSEGLGGIYFDEPKTAQFLGIAALTVILFSGGLSTEWRAIKPVLWQGIALSTVGVLATALSVGLFVAAVTNFSLYEGLLLGAIVSSTDAAAVFSILRARSLGLKHNLRPTLELESGSNDPMAYFLTIAFTGLVAQPVAGLLPIVPLFIQQIVIGGVAGLGFGLLGKFMLNRLQPDFDGLYPVLALALAFAAFSATDLVGGNGFLAVYIAGVYLGNQPLIHKRNILQTFDGFAWLMQIVLFITLGLLVFPSQVLPVVGIGLLISAFLILVARPVGVFLSLAFFKMPARSRLFASWVGLRGAVPIVFATYPLLAGLEKAQMIFNIVFFISLTSVLVQGTSLAAAARWLRVALPDAPKEESLLDNLLRHEVKSEFVEVVVGEHSPVRGRRIVDLNFPKSAIIAMLKRRNHFVTPTGATALQEGDTLMILAEDPESLALVHEILG
ncbi:potassium/proton antiporter [Hymenobacter saemangeumensis]|uniref:Potassium/proton antiporter n=1 Tax=Hymenobacter saemangeumensis TaxID=1084522 RepID=A0ABP8IQY8_9BACT